MSEWAYIIELGVSVPFSDPDDVRAWPEGSRVYHAEVGGFATATEAFSFANDALGRTTLEVAAALPAGITLEGDQTEPAVSLAEVDLDTLPFTGFTVVRYDDDEGTDGDWLIEGNRKVTA